MDEIRSLLFSKSSSKSINSSINTASSSSSSVSSVSSTKQSLPLFSSLSLSLSTPKELTVVKPTSYESSFNYAIVGFDTSSTLMKIYGNREMTVSVKVDKSSCKESEVKLNRSFREYVGLLENDKVKVVLVNKNLPIIKNIYLKVEWDTLPLKQIKINEDDIIARFSSLGLQTVLSKSQSFLWSSIDWTRRAILQVTIEDMDGIENGIYTDETKLYCVGDCVRNNKLLSLVDLNFINLGIGGQDEKLEEIFTRAFLTRSIRAELYEKLGVKHIKGILMYGPPGCGKTLIARNLAKILNCEEPVIINAPEILGKFVGESESKLRAPFEKAAVNPHDLHVIIIDEIDAICRQRGGDGTRSNVTDSLVNQLLTRMDGVNELNNILVIGMTNRKELLDEALLRPGRFEIHLEIGLPDLEGRKQILTIHTSTMRKNGILSADINIDAIASLTVNMTGAELAAVCKEAVNSSLSNVIDVHKLDTSSKVNTIQVSHIDFMKALEIVKPHFGSNHETLSTILSLKYKEPDEKFLAIKKEIFTTIKDTSSDGIHPLLIYGDSAKGKTLLATTISKELDIPFTRYISANDTVSLGEKEKCDNLIKIFREATKVSNSLIIIDDISIFCEWTPPNYFSNKVIQCLKTLLGTTYNKGKMFVILCSTDYEDLDDKKLWERVSIMNRYEL